VSTALIVTITEGVELLPQAAFLSSALRGLGLEPRLLATDFCTTQDGFQTAVTEAQPSAVLFVDALEWREILVTLTGFALEVISAPVIIATALAPESRPSGFDSRVTFVADGDFAALAAALGVEARPIDVSKLPLDYGLFGGPGLLARAMGCSLFGDLGVLPVLASRPRPKDTSPTAAVARLEGALSSGPVAIEHRASLLAGAVGVELWDRSLPAGALSRVIPRSAAPSLTVRLLPAELPRLREEWGDERVTRIALECDALDEAPELRLPNAAGTASEVAAAAGLAKLAGLEIGVLLVIGLPGETVAHTKARCDRLRELGIARVRVVPFEPAGGTAAWDWCVDKHLWPPAENRWNRELYQPLRQPESTEYPGVLEEALGFVAEVEAQAGAST
jgi:hypothetical protein